MSFLKRVFLRSILTDADQIYGSETQEQDAARISSRLNMRHSVGGEGDAFATQFRFMYAEAIRRKSGI